MRILIVDDEASLRNLFEIGLMAENREIISCEDGYAALGILEKSSFDLVLLDLKMPGMSGLGVLQVMRERGNMTRVIICSAFVPDSALVRAISSGVVHFMGKPMSLLTLRNNVDECLDKKNNSIESQAFRCAERLEFSKAAELLESKKEESPALRLWRDVFADLSSGKSLKDLLGYAEDLSKFAILRDS